MDKIIFRVEFDRVNVKLSGIEVIWYMVVREFNELEELVSINLWNRDEVVLKKKFYLLDDCVIVIWLVRFED